MRPGLMRFAALIAAIACPLAHATSFDCDSQTLARVEKMICARDTLGRLDDDMALGYRDAHMLASVPGEVAASQRRWLAARDLCVDAACVAHAYQSRLKELRQTPRAARQEFDDPASRLHFRYLGNRVVKHCTSESATACFELAGPGMAYGSTYFLRFELVEGSLANVADSLWEKEGDGWVAFGRGRTRSPVETLAGEGWHGLVVGTMCAALATHAASMARRGSVAPM
jgi:uncharacterized protein